jgi:hypothetical protein
MMKKYRTTEEMINLLDSLIVGDDITSDEVELFEDVMQRLSDLNKQIDHMRERTDIAANIIGHNTISEVMYEQC